jgi:hypothetical protein
MSITHKDLAQLSADIYHEELGTSWTELHPETSTNPIHWGYINHSDARVVVFRGSLAFLDWLSDAEALLEPTPLGQLAVGFYKDLQPIVDHLIGLPDLPTYIAGHSLGAARAANLSGLLALAGHKPAGRVTWGMPGLGLHLNQSAYALPESATYITEGGLDFFTPIVDPVTIVPLGYEHPQEPRQHLPAEALRALNPLVLHSMADYANLTPAIPLGAK